jgi:hypothetical protein
MAAAPDWTIGLSEEDRGLVQLKKYGSPADVVKALRHAQQFIGAPADELVRIPKAGLDIEGVKSIMAKLGMPAKPEEYQLPVPQEGGDPEFAKAASGWFHKYGLTREQAVGIVNEVNAWVGEAQKTAKETHENGLRMEEAQLKTEWGEAYQRRWQVAKNAAGQLGLTAEHLAALQNAMGPAAMVKFVYGMAARLGEDRFLGGDHVGNGLTPAMADQRIQELKSDKAFMGRLMSGDKKAAKEWEDVHRAKNPPMDNQ